MRLILRNIDKFAVILYNNIHFNIDLNKKKQYLYHNEYESIFRMT